MNHLQRSTQTGIELQNSATSPPAGWKRRKVAIWLFAIIIILAMLGWLAFLGWGAIAFWQWVSDHTRSLWTTNV
jgi:hypothetical protein